MGKYPNAIQCLKCKKVLVSFDRHDFKGCGCPNGTFIDGGYDYFRCGGRRIDLIQVLKFIRVTRKVK